MSPDSPHPSATRRAWRFMSALGCILGAGAILCSVVLYTQIQDSRVDSIRSQCIELNMRHDRTIDALDRILTARLRTADPALRARLRQSRQTTTLLIEALAPRRNCDKRVADLTQ